MEHTLLLLHGEEIKDSSDFNVPLTNNGVQVSSTQSKFGEKSLYFNNNTSIKAIIPVSGDMTLDCWVYMHSYAPNYPTPFEYADGNNNGNYIHATSTTTFCRVQKQPALQEKQLPPLPLNQWIHLAFVRHGADTLFFENGILKWTQTNSDITKNDKISLGQFYSGDPVTFYIGYIDEFRVSDIARWTSDFTPPTEPYGQKPDFSYEMQVPVGSSKKIYARLYLKNPDDYFQTDLTKAAVDLTVSN